MSTTKNAGDISQKSELEHLRKRISELEESVQQEQLLAHKSEAHLKQVLLAVRKSNQLIVAETDPKVIIQGVCTMLTETLGHHNAWIILMDEKCETVTLSASSGFEDGFDIMDERLTLGEIPPCMERALVQDTPVVIDEPTGKCRSCPLVKDHTGSVGMTCRLALDGRVYGALSVSVPAVFAHSVDAFDIFSQIGSGLAFALRRIEDTRRLRQITTIVGDSPAVAFIWENEESWPVRFASANTERLFGIPAEDFISGKVPFSAVIHPEDLDRVMEEVASYSADTNADAVVHLPYRIITAEGHVKWVEDKSTIQRAADGLVKAYHGILMDITERKQAENEIKKFNTIADLAMNGIAITDLQGTISYINDYFARAHGYAIEDVIGHKISLFHSEAQMVAVRALIEDAMAEGGAFEMTEVWHQHRDGTEFPMLMSGVVVTNEDGEPQYMAATAIDITERKIIEEALVEARATSEKAARAKSDFLAKMSHEIRTPMGAIIGLNHLLRKSGLTPAQAQYVDKQRGASRTLMGIIDDVLDMSRIEVGRIRLEKRLFSVIETLRDVMSIAEVSAQDRNVDLVVDLAPDMPDQIFGDSLRVRQILLNLLSNAVKFTTVGQVVLGAELVSRTGDSVLLRFSVTDTGCGIAPSQLDGVFDAFTQEDDSTTRQFGGSGLGLTISKELAEMMEGRLEVESQKGCGSTFTFSARFDAMPQEARPASRAELASLKVLVVEHRGQVGLSLMRVVQSFCGEVALVSGPESAMTRLEQGEKDAAAFDLVLVAARLMGSDGSELATRIKASTALRIPPKVVLNAGSETTGDQKSASNPSVDGVLYAPVTLGRLIEMVKTIFQSFEDVQPDEVEKRASTLQNIVMIRGARALVVDDNEINLQLLKELLEDEEVHVDLASDGVEAVAKVRDAKTPYDIVLMDLQMPVMDGFEATRRIRERWPAGEVPVIAITADVVGDVRERVSEAGFDDYLSKPISPTALLGMLVRHVRRNEETAGLPAARQSPAETRPAPEPSATTLMIPGVDTESGLARWAGKVQIYRAMLGRFAVDHADLGRTIRQLLKAGNTDEAMRVAHRLKGVAGNLSVTKVWEIVTRVHEMLRIGDVLPDDALLEALEHQSDLAVTAIREAGCTVASEEDAAEDQLDLPVEPDEVTQLVDDLAELLRQGDAKAVELVRILQGPLLALGFHDDAQQLLRLVLLFEYDKGLEVLARIGGLLLASRHEAERRDE